MKIFERSSTQFQLAKSHTFLTTSSYDLYHSPVIVEVSRGNDDRAGILDTLQHRVRRWEFELQWVMEVCSRESTRIECSVEQQDQALIEELIGE